MNDEKPCKEPIDLSGLEGYLRLESTFKQFRIDNHLHDMSDLWIKVQLEDIAKLNGWANAVAKLTAGAKESLCSNSAIPAGFKKS